MVQNYGSVVPELVGRPTIPIKALRNPHTYCSVECSIVLRGILLQPNPVRDIRPSQQRVSFDKALCSFFFYFLFFLWFTITKTNTNHVSLQLFHGCLRRGRSPRCNSVVHAMDHVLPLCAGCHEVLCCLSSPPAPPRRCGGTHERSKALQGRNEPSGTRDTNSNSVTTNLTRVLTTDRHISFCKCI